MKIRRFGAVLEADGDRLLLWVPGCTPNDGTWMAAPENLPTELRYEGATFEVESEEHDVGGGRFSHQFGCDCPIHEHTAWPV